MRACLRGKLRLRRYGIVSLRTCDSPSFRKLFSGPASVLSGKVFRVGEARASVVLQAPEENPAVSAAS